MVGRHHRLNGYGFGWTPGVGDGQGGLACCNSWGHKESDTTEWLNWTELKVERIEHNTVPNWLVYTGTTHSFMAALTMPMEPAIAVLQF